MVERGLESLNYFPFPKHGGFGKLKPFLIIKFGYALANIDLCPFYDNICG